MVLTFFFSAAFIVNVNHNIDHWVILKELNMVLKKSSINFAQRCLAVRWSSGILLASVTRNCLNIS